MSEGLNPTRRYRSFRPRQAARGYVASGNGAAHATAGLYNNSTGAQWLVLRDFELGSDASLSLYGTAYVHGTVGTIGGITTPLIPDSAGLPGQLFSGDLATLFTFDYQPFQLADHGGSFRAWWNHEYPFAILPPNWSLVFQDSGNGGDMAISLLWEAIYPDELDYAFEL